MLRTPTMFPCNCHVDVCDLLTLILECEELV